MMTITPGVMTLTIPAVPEHVRFARLLAGGLATQSGFDVDAVEDVRIAVDECCHALIGACEPDATITLSCSADDAGIRIEGRCPARAASDVAVDLDEFSEAILNAVVDDYEVFRRDGDVGFSLRRVHHVG